MEKGGAAAIGVAVLALAGGTVKVATHDSKPAAQVIERGAPGEIRQERRFEMLESLEDPGKEVLKHCAQDAIKGENCIPEVDNPSTTLGP